MTIAGSTFLLALGITGWESVGGQLLASGVLLLSGRQDIGLRARMGAAAHARFDERFTEAAVMRTATELYAELRAKLG